MAFHRDPLTDPKPGDARTQRFHPAGYLVAEYGGQLHTRGKRRAAINVHVGAADPGSVDGDRDFARAGIAPRHIVQRKPARAGRDFTQCEHR